MSATIEQKANSAVENASQTAHSAINQAADKLRPTVDQLTAGAHKVLDRVSSAASYAADTLEVKGEQLKKVQEKVTASTRSYVQEKPITSIGIAVAAGFALSWLLRQR